VRLYLQSLSPWCGRKDWSWIRDLLGRLFFFYFYNLRWTSLLKKNAKLDVEYRAQREYWEAEMVRDEEEWFDWEVVKVMMEKMTEHLDTDMAGFV
jgi:hypothetical protein